MKALLVALFLTTAQPTELDVTLPAEVQQACEAGGGCVLITQRALEFLAKRAESCRGTSI